MYKQLITSNRIYRITTKMIILYIACLSQNSFAQKQVIKPDISRSRRFQLVNRKITISTNKDGKAIVHLDSKPNQGIAWIKGLTFKSGNIEFDVKGKNVLQQSFVGVAFHGLNDSTFDVVYFRPFNFQSADAIRKSHSVQYISLPQYDWQILREKYPGKYENALSSTIEPESWFHAKITVKANNIVVYVNNDIKPALTITPLTNRTVGNIGFWAGNNSDGDFSNLTIQNKR